MAPKPNVPPVNRSGQKHFNVANIDKMDPEQRKKILGHIVDLMDEEDNLEKGWVEINGHPVLIEDFKEGDTVQFKEPMADEVGVKLKIIENRGNRLLVEHQVDMDIKPTSVVSIDDVEYPKPPKK